jgi:hypothetical protein
VAQIEADYLGGDPSELQPYTNGTLATAEGSLAYTVQVLTGSLTSERFDFTIPFDEIRAMSVGDANHMKALTRTAVGAALGGSAGALLGLPRAAATTRSWPLAAARTSTTSPPSGSVVMKGQDCSTRSNQPPHQWPEPPSAGRAARRAGSP